jgi:hypothetical protein
MSQLAWKCFEFIYMNRTFTSAAGTSHFYKLALHLRQVNSVRTQRGYNGGSSTRFAFCLDLHKIKDTIPLGS